MLMTTISRALLALLTSLTLSGAACSGQAANTSDGTAADAEHPAAAGGSVDGPTAHRLVAEGALLLDVRTPGEYATGHVDGAVNIPHDQVGAQVGELEPKSRPIVVYCHSGRRSAIAATTLRAEGFTVHDLGPMTAW